MDKYVILALDDADWVTSKVKIPNIGEVVERMNAKFDPTTIIALNGPRLYKAVAIRTNTLEFTMDPDKVAIYDSKEEAIKSAYYLGIKNPVIVIQRNVSSMLASIQYRVTFNTGRLKFINFERHE